MTSHVDSVECPRVVRAALACAMLARVTFAWTTLARVVFACTTLARVVASIVTVIVIAAAMLAASVAPAHAAPVKLDDTGTHLTPPSVRMVWRDVSGAGARQMQAQARLSVRLDTRAYAGRQARIHLVMPQDIGGSLAMHWQTLGVLMPGRIAPGERVLVFQGRIPGPVIEDHWSLLLVADGEWMNESRRLDCSFDIEME